MSEYKRVCDKVPELFKTLMVPHIQRLNVALSSGLTVLRWTSIKLAEFIESANKAISELEQLIDTVEGVHKNRVLRAFQEIRKVELIAIPATDVISIQELVQTTESLCNSGAKLIDSKSLMAEMASAELVGLLLRSEEDIPLAYPTNVSSPGAMTLTRKIEQRAKLRQEAEILLQYYQQLNVDALLLLLKRVLETVRKRMSVSASLSYSEYAEDAKKERHPLFSVNLVLALPCLVMRPSLDEVQKALNRAISLVLSVTKSVYCWGQDRSLVTTSANTMHVGSAANLRHRGKTENQTPNLPKLKNYYHAVAEHKEVVKLASVLSSSINSTKTMVQKVIDQFSKYEHLWAADRDEQVAKFAEEEPSVSDYEMEMHYYTQQEAEVQQEPDVITAGAIALNTEELKHTLSIEAQQWRVRYGRTMSQHYQGIMDEIFKSIEEWTSLISRPLKDLDDVRSVMATLKEIRENEIRIDRFLGPIEVSTGQYVCVCVCVSNSCTKVLDGVK